MEPEVADEIERHHAAFMAKTYSLFEQALRVKIPHIQRFIDVSSVQKGQ
jgi:hypothetical protein